MRMHSLWKPRVIVCLALMALVGGLASCNGGDDAAAPAPGPVSGGPGGGPANPGSPPAHTLGNVENGRTVFRTETFGNERFWTDAIRLPAGVVAAKVTPLQALGLGLHVDVDAVPAATVTLLAAELLLDPTGKTSKILNDPATTVALINANAVIGLPAKDGKVGASCALCHADTDGSVLNIPNGGSIGKRRDGGASHTLDFGTLLSIGTNSRAYYPALQLALAANGGKTLGRASTGLTEDSTEAQVDAYLKDKKAYPVGMFDDTIDGNGDPMHNMPLFRQDLAHPFGSEGAIAKLDNFSNLVYTALLDPTTIMTPGGRAFLKKTGGDAAGDEIADDYAKVLAATGVTGPFPFIQASAPGNPALAGTEEFPLGVRVDETKLNDMNAFLFALAAPAGKAGDQASVDRGRTAFQSNSCTNCHNVGQGTFVPTFIVPMKTIFPGDNPIVLLPQRTPPLNPILDTPSVFFDDKMAVVNASFRGLERGTALPLLLDLDRKPVFLHDNSVPSLDALFDSSRGADAPHPFYLSDTAERGDVVTFLRSLGTN